MKIIWYGHSCFKIEGLNGSVILDPFQNDYIPGIKNLPLNLTADEVICSHNHGDHNAENLIKLSNNHHGYEIKKLESYHDNQKGALRGKNLITVINIDGFKIVHFGDIGCELPKIDKQYLYNADIAMIPVGGYYTINSEEALKIIDSINARITIPMHYRGFNFGFDVISPIDEYLKLVNNAIFLSDNIIDISHADLEKKSTLIFKLP